MKDCDPRFPKMEDTHHTLLVALISSYKRSMHEKKKGEPSLKKKNREKQKENRE